MMKFVAALVLTLSYLAPRLLTQYSKNFAGPFTLNLRGIEDCPNHESLPVKINGNKIRKYNRTTFLYSINLSTSLSISDDMQMAVAFSTFGNGGWSNVQIEQHLGPMCTGMWKLVPGMMKAFMEALGQKDCPIKPGNYSVNNFILDLNANWPLLPYDRYRFEARYYLDGKLVGCKRAFVDCVPKKERRPR